MTQIAAKMKTANFTYGFFTKLDPKEIYLKLLDIPYWWSGLYNEEIKGESDKINDVFTFLAGDGVHYSEQKLIELVPNKKIVWQVTDSKLTFLENPTEWNASKIIFDISTQVGKTKVVFIHEGLTPEIECYNDCSMGWTGYLKNFEAKCK